MNKIRIINFAALMMATLVLGGCKKWVEVSPKSVIRDEDFFTSDLAFREAINGVYYKMGQTELYGREMTWGMVDVLGGMYTIEQANTPFEYIAVDSREFQDIDFEKKIEEIWKGSYNCIANINNLIKNLEQADESLFNSGNRSLLLGEALGLRAFLHFDLLRLFAPAPGKPGSELPAIPYVEAYSTTINPRIPVGDVLLKIQQDLSHAEQLLADDPIIHLNAAAPSQLTFRKVRLNYYGVKALQARVQLWSGNKEQALAAARSVIDAQPGRFNWVNRNSLTTGGSLRDRIFSTELITGLVVEKMYENTNQLLYNVWEGLNTNNSRRALFISSAKRQDMFEASTVGLTDYRNVYLVAEENGPGFGTLTNPNCYVKYDALTYVDSLNFRMPLFRVSEMYYIAAECLAATQPVEAVDLLNIVRTQRGILDNLPQTLSASAIGQEIRKEYVKEFTCEGQVFFYRKRLGELTDVLPLPLWELENGR